MRMMWALSCRKGLAFCLVGNHTAQVTADQALLSALGVRLRREREAAGWTLSELALRAGLSRRYVTEAEAGRANLSLLKLAGLARALRLPLGQLCDLPLDLRRSERIALVGLRGAGKTSVGRALALELEAPFVELDERVERMGGMGLAELFDLRGVPTYRRLEREALETVLGQGQRLVLATGGSIVTSPATFARLRDACRTVWLQATPEDHLRRVLAQGDQRPTKGRPRAMEELQEILERRAERYAQCELVVSTSGRNIEQVKRAVLDGLAATGAPTA